MNRMKTASIHELKNTLQHLSQPELIKAILRLARYKKENKELLTYLLYESQDEKAYITSIQNEIDTQFTEINKSHIYFAKKSIRKILKFTTTSIRYSGRKETEVELLIHFCKKLKYSGIPLYQSVALSNLYQRQIQKISRSLKSLHEDLQYDYGEELKPLLKIRPEK